MSTHTIPDHIDPYRMAEQSQHLSGCLQVSEMPRLANNILPSDAMVEVNLDFNRDEQGVYSLIGQLKTVLSLQCQRCMEPFIYEIITSFHLGIVKTIEEANNLPEKYEPALTQDGSLALRELIEDEIILNLPIIPKHDTDECKVKLPWKDGEWEERDNPFQVLASLKERNQ